MDGASIEKSIWARERRSDAVLAVHAALLATLLARFLLAALTRFLGLLTRLTRLLAALLLAALTRIVLLLLIGHLVTLLE